MKVAVEEGGARLAGPRTAVPTCCEGKRTEGMGGDAWAKET